MILTEDLLATAYRKATGKYLSTHHVDSARKLILAVFDEMQPAGYLNPDGAFFQEEWEAGADCEEVFRRPE